MLVTDLLVEMCLVYHIGNDSSVNYSLTISSLMSRLQYIAKQCHAEYSKDCKVQLVMGDAWTSPEVTDRQL